MFFRYNRPSYFVIALFFLFIITSCSSDDSVSEPQPFGPDRASIKIGDQTFEMHDFEELNIIGGNTNCGNLFVSLNAFNDDFTYRLSLSFLESGELQEVFIRDYNNVIRGGRPNYLSPLYQPEVGIDVERFEYDAVNEELDLKISGRVILEDTSGYDQSLDFEVDTQLFAVQDISCSFIRSRDIQFNSASFSFNNVDDSSSFITGTLPRTSKFYSNNGYRLTIYTEDNPWLMNEGSYSFNPNSSTNRMVMEKYVGEIRATQAPIEDENEWTIIPTAGDLVIDSKDTVEGQNIVYGHIDFQTLSNNELDAIVQNMEFLLPDF